VADFDVRLDPGAVRELLNGSTGDVYRHLLSESLRVSNRAKELVGVDRGDLRRDIGLRPGRDSTGAYLDVGSGLSYALVHHNGSAPHTIRPRSRRMLRFQVGGRTVYARSTRHPGTAGTRYLTRALEVLS